MRNRDREVVTPLLRFEYSFDAEVLDHDLRLALAGDETVNAPVVPFLTVIREALEAALATIPGLHREVGLSEMRCPGATELPSPTHH